MWFKSFSLSEKVSMSVSDDLYERSAGRRMENGFLPNPSTPLPLNVAQLLGRSPTQTDTEKHVQET